MDLSLFNFQSLSRWQQVVYITLLDATDFGNWPSHTHIVPSSSSGNPAQPPTLYLRYLNCTTLPNQNHPSNNQATNAGLEALDLALSNQPGQKTKNSKAAM
jgi:hypothetical protein